MKTNIESSISSIRALCVLLFLLGPSLLHGQTWDYSEEVSFQELGEQTWVALVDGRELRIEYNEQFFEQLFEWSSGKALVLAYNSADGLVLLDPSSGESAHVLTGPEKHPIDSIVDQCLEGSLTTREMVECYNDGNSRWNKELDRIYDSLMSSLPAEKRDTVEVAQTRWLAFRDAQSAALRAIYDEGTASYIWIADEVMDLTRIQALRLARLK